MAYDELTADRVRKALTGRRGVTSKPMMGGLVFMVGGAMCCSVSGRGGLLVRVSPQTRDRMLSDAHVTPAEMRGRIMTGFVRVAPDGYRTDAALKRWVERGLEGIAASREKPLAKSKAGKTAPRKAVTARKTTTRSKASPGGKRRAKKTLK